MCGLKIPSTIIVDNKIDYLNCNINPKVSKPIQNSLHLKNNMDYYVTRNIRLGNNFKLGSKFFPSLIQQEIDKEFEVKVFFLGNKIFSMAIMSKDSKYVDIKENSTKDQFYLPYKLENEIKEKLKKIIHKSGLKIGTIDLIFSKQNEYIFLEINPAGQFGDISAYCNYNLEYEVAKYLKMKNGKID